jgi:signal peptidase II
VARRPSAAALAEAEDRRHLRLMAGVAGGTFLLDQFTKWLVVHRLGLRDRGEIEVLPPLLNFRMAWNQGVNFGLGAQFDMRWVLVGVAVAISILVVAWVRRDRMGWWAHLSVGLLVGGALGNVVDRVLYGAVADFLNFPFFGDLLSAVLGAATFGWLSLDAQYSLNVADIAIFLGAGGLILFSGRGAGGSGAARRSGRSGASGAGSGRARGGDAGPKAR